MSSRGLHERLAGIAQLTPQAGVHYPDTESSCRRDLNG